MNSQYSKLTLDITKKLTKSVKKEYGIFITPQSIITDFCQSIFQKIILMFMRFLGIQKKMLVLQKNIKNKYSQYFINIISEGKLTRLLSLFDKNEKELQTPIGLSV